ncbi:hypothetical protein FisN_8Hh001 [Fistulifera solaris]|uniref:General transcription factor TFIIB n=1 Tax=Fistulifera solaris TaxID=1519565 RepID=A0A1Z5JJH1_FISSO|nr:hypothetical protein FisN_8Hh001 [Fistulifera solaris]|eukprot:GAX14160.1 hypothetical protein FisN_8Hh001 [Fistulifera solaris]
MTSLASDPPVWEFDEIAASTWLMKTLREAYKVVVGDASAETASNENLDLWHKNIVSSAQAIKFSAVHQGTDGEDDDDAPPAKRRKQMFLDDPCHVWWISKYTEKPAEPEENEDDLPAELGGRLAQFTPGAWLNAMAAAPVVRKSHPSSKLVQEGATASGVSLALPSNRPAEIEKYMSEIWEVAQGIYRLVQATVQKDIWRTTPYRIQQRLAPEVPAQEFASIRKRIYDTVILGKGLHVNDEEDDTAVAIGSQVHESEKYKKCPNCGNMDQSSFALDQKNGDIICSNCGVVVSESLMHEGSAYRKFEGEEDRNHHGDAPNSLFSNARNLSTSLSGIAPTSGIGGYKGGGGSLETILRNTHAYTELNVSQYGKTDRRTREGYKDRQKKEAFNQMTHTGDALNLHEAVVRRAKELFAGFRDDRELVQQFKGVLAACLCEAFEQLAAEGSNGMLVKGVGSSAVNLAIDELDESQLTGRAARRNQLHKVTLAGKGGLQVDFSSIEEKEQRLGKPVAQWNLEDCRSWLLQASRKIAQQWVEERQAAPASKRNQWPEGSLEELEGQLVEHSITLCEHLEEELKSRNKGDAKMRTVTPRINDMSKLGIKWQHKHERGSGGKGGLGGSGPQAANGTGSERTAGQTLLRQNAKKMAMIIKDQRAAEALHKELRWEVGKEEELKRKQIHEQASRQRLNQMQRKRWLQAKVQG